VISSVKKGAAIIEITSGTTNALLKLTALKETKYGEALSEYLFYLEMLSLSVDVTDWISKGLKKSATNVLEHSDELNKHLDDLVKKGELDEVGKTRILDELSEVAELDFLAKWDDLPVSGKGYLEGKTLRRKEIKIWIENVKIVSKGQSKLIILPKGHKLLGVNQAGFNPFNGNIYVQKGLTEYEIFHEFKHLEEYIKLGKDEYLKGMKRISGSLEQDLIRTYKREKYVFDEIIKNKNKFNQIQLNDAQKYINAVIERCENAGIDITKI